MWTWVIADQHGTALLDARNAKARTATFTRNRPAAVTFTASLLDAEAEAIADVLRNGLPRLRGYRDGVLRFSTRWGPMREHADETAQGTADALEATFRGADAALEGRFTPAADVHTAEDAGQLAMALITAANADHPTGLIAGTIAATTDRDRTYDRKQILEAIVQLTEVDGGFDYEAAPVHLPTDPATLARFDVHADQGVDHGDNVAFEFGPDTAATLQGVSRQWALPVNRAVVLGADGLVGIAEDADSIAAYDLHEIQESGLDVAEQATLDAKAAALLRPDPVRVLEFAPDPACGFRPWDDFWLGDTVRLRVRYGALLEDLPVRINQITVTPGDDDDETYTLAVEAPAATGPLRLPPRTETIIKRLRAEVAALGRAQHGA